MCRYSTIRSWSGRYKDHYACLSCKQTFKSDIPRPCNSCGKNMVSMGLDFKPPRKTNDTQWQKIRILYEKGLTFHTCGCTGPGYRPKSVGEAKTMPDNKYRAAAYKKWR